MQTFSKRNKLKSEYSGYGEASYGLRNRLLLLYGHPYSGDEHNFGINNENWIHERAFSKDLQMHFGRKVLLEDFRDEKQTSYDQVFDFIELYYKRAEQDLGHIKRLNLLRDISLAFFNSGSVYQIDKDGQVILKIEDSTAERIARVDGILKPFDNAQKAYRDCVDGLITRSKPPKNIVGDMNVVFEEYLKNVTQQKNIDKAIQYLQTKLSFHPTQVQAIEKLRAYRGDVWGAAHAGNSPEPDERDALWYLESIIVQINYIDSKIR